MKRPRKNDKKEKAGKNSWKAADKSHKKNKDTEIVTHGDGFGAYQSDMPLYCAAINKKGVVALGGGGGKSKTGIPNAIVLLNWDSAVFAKIATHDTGDDAIMNLDFHPSEDVIVYGTRDKSIILHFSGSVFTQEGSVQTVNVEDHEQKVVRFNHGGDRILTGTSDGSFKLWSYPGLKTISTMLAHADEIYDADFSSSGALFATSSRDQTCKIWSYSGSVKCNHTLQFPAEGGRNAVMRGCRFDTNGTTLYTAQSVRSTSTYIAAWDPETGTLLRKGKVHNEHHTCFALSPNDEYCAIGTAEKVVRVIRTDSLRPIMTIQDHGFIVTNLAFSPDSLYIISTGADHACTYRKIKPDSLFNMKIIFCVISILLLILSFIVKSIVAL